ncbi:response regulator transcription factor [Kineosporia sp. J2-2]|uniref:Response regulator transcription factor n=1 Tax=Kineosporia corallincola TaxID=2835133 RepID=A0ABS5T961_9ACTN|nr:response regulator transcription factor [Kineosporia corallincola]MBT0767614.1 response regulator transcription factor [Kineosporia corallincola]
MRTTVIVDDDPETRMILRAALESTGFTVFEATTGHDAVSLVREHNPDLITLDLVLPGFDGVEVCRRIRELTDAYIIMITASSDEADRLVGLATGADDYVTKPFSPREVQARVAAMFRRPRRVARAEPAAPPNSGGTEGQSAETGGRSYLNGPAPQSVTGSITGLQAGRRRSEGRHAYANPGGATVPDAPPWGPDDVHEDPGMLRHGQLTIDVEGRIAAYAGTELPLTKIEFDLLATMSGNPRRVWRRETLLNIVWGGQWSDHHVVEVHIGNLRRKLADVAGAGVPIIKTVRGIGYRMAPVDPAQSAGHHAGLPTTY